MASLLGADPKSMLVAESATVGIAVIAPQAPALNALYLIQVDPAEHEPVVNTPQATMISPEVFSIAKSNDCTSPPAATYSKLVSRVVPGKFPQELPSQTAAPKSESESDQAIAILLLAATGLLSSLIQ